MAGAALVRVSATKLGTWQSCPRRFFFDYVARERMPRQAWAHFTVGNAVHLALRDAYGDEESAALDASALVSRHWSDEGFRDAAQSAQWRERATAQVRAYLDAGPGRLVHSTERALGARTDRIVIDARIDRLDEAGDGALVVVDYKTGKRPPTVDDARSSQALAFYALATRQSLRRPCTRVELHHLPTGERVAWEHDDASIARQVARAEDLAGEMQAAVDSWEGSDGSPAALDGIFPAMPGPLCGFCDAHARCPAGQAATAAREPWAGLDDDGLAGAPEA